jgi:hypothetical protein
MIEFNQDQLLKHSWQPDDYHIPITLSLILLETCSRIKIRLSLCCYKAYSCNLEDKKGFKGIKHDIFTSIMVIPSGK